MYHLQICHLYPELMNIYGDRGNIICLQQRMKWRNIESTVVHHSVGDVVEAGKNDIYFIGGGQDQAQQIIAEDLLRNSEALVEDIKNGVCALAVCGGYQLFGRSYRDQAGNEIPGIGLFDVETHAGKVRMVGNILIKLESILAGTHVIGFENHSGRTTLGSNAQPLGRVVSGLGNNGRDKTEGVVFHNAVGTYLHGPILPKNPKLADYFISQSMERRHGVHSLSLLDDSFEQSAFKEAKSRL